MEADKDVTSLIAVSDITTESVTGIVQMPICKYEVDILDSNGCALDRYVLNDLEYPEDLLAGQEAHVYKYADRDSLYYQCQISLQVKENGECVRPICADFFNSPPFKVFHKNRQAYDRVLARLRDPEINRNTTTSFSQHASNYSQADVQEQINTN
ncbi:hypothetical protein RB195_000795 [Necator americanus]|uniref:ZP domain-containing protein n=1 Tax=Necator americanus TaxID=51031 RepID=A0ABR1DED1_NECAM